MTVRARLAPRCKKRHPLWYAAMSAAVLALVGLLVVFSLPVTAIVTTNATVTDPKERDALIPGHFGVSHLIRFADLRWMVLQLAIYAICSVLAISASKRMPKRARILSCVAIVTVSLSVLLVKVFPYYSDDCTAPERASGKRGCSSEARERFFRVRHSLISLVAFTVPLILFSVCAQMCSAERAKVLTRVCVACVVAMIIAHVASSGNRPNKALYEATFEILEWACAAIIAVVPLLLVTGKHARHHLTH